MENWTLPTPAEQEEIRRAEEIARRAKALSDEERRCSARLAMHANVSLHSETNFFTGFTENLSEGGVFVATMSPPSIGERVQLRITVDGGGGVFCEGIVRWMRTDETGCFTGCGIQFVDLNEGGQQAVEAMYRSLARDPLLCDF